MDILKNTAKSDIEWVLEALSLRTILSRQLPRIESEKRGTTSSYDRLSIEYENDDVEIYDSTTNSKFVKWLHRGPTNSFHRAFVSAPFFHEWNNPHVSRPWGADPIPRLVRWIRQAATAGAEKGRQCYSDTGYICASTHWHCEYVVYEIHCIPFWPGFCDKITILFQCHW